MRVILVLIVAVFGFSGKMLAQKANSANPEPLVLVDNFTTDIKSLILEPEKIKSIDVYKDTSALRLYGEKGKNGVVVIQTKEKINFLRLNELFDKYGLPDSSRKLRVCIDEVIIKTPGLILADPDEVGGLGTMTITDWDVLKPQQSEKVINIKTKKKS